MTLLAIFLWMLPSTVRADLTTLYVKVAPSTVAPASTTIFTVRINNASENTGEIQWLRIIRPSANFTISAVTLADWEGSLDGESATLRSNILHIGQEAVVTVIVQAANVVAPAAQWAVEASEDPDGANPFFYINEDPEMATAIEGEPIDNSPPVISNISISSLTPTSATVSWKTDEPATAVLNYGQSSSYGLKKQRSELQNSHTFTVAGLVPATAYHYQLVNTDIKGNVRYFGDNTFYSAELPLVTPSTPVVVTPGSEKIPPKLSVSTVIGGVYRIAPSINGTASDNQSVGRIEVSIDGGKSYQRLEGVAGLGSIKASFSYSAKELEDATYQVVFRVYDAALNTATSPIQTMTIDSGPPVLSPALIAVNQQITPPLSDGRIVTTINTDQRLTLGASGGPVSVTLLAANSTEGGQVNQQFEMTRSSVNGLWTAVTRFEKPGIFNIQAAAVDSVSNRSEAVVATFVVAKPGVVLDQAKSPIGDAIVSLYVRDKASKKWQLWDAGAFSQRNPQVVGPDGTYTFLAPQGSYHIRVAADGYRTLVSRPFGIQQTKPISAAIDLKVNPTLKLGKLKLRLPIYNEALLEQGELVRSAQGNQSGVFPNFDLPTPSGETVSSLSLRGRPTLVTFVTTWSPAAREQLAILEQVAANKDVNILPVFLLEGSAKVRAYQSVSGSTARVVVDKDGLLQRALLVPSTPTHYFIDRKNNIERTVSGVLSENEIMKELRGVH